MFSSLPQSEPQMLQLVQEFELLSDERKVEAGTPEACYWELKGNKELIEIILYGDYWELKGNTGICYMEIM